MARWIHHVVMWLLLGFTVHHVYSAVLVAIIEKNGTSTRFRRLQVGSPKGDLGPGPYRWLHKGEIDE